MKFYIGIDPGSKGAMCVINEDRKICQLIPYSKPLYLRTIMAHSWGDAVACVEKVHAMPKQGSVSMFTFGELYGWLQGVLDNEGIPYQLIPPQTWKKEFGLNSDKTKSIEVAKQLFPDANLIPDGCRKESDGLAEALLMAEYARRKL